ncbi:virB8 family protein [Allosphingosinicella sp.]|jgi:type IV secretion system protein VirB8|uniref:virB8 family protein n=1 Tax=Allosphingosinicella sp. TaxID=2823234 RepID=UPI002EFFA804
MNKRANESRETYYREAESWSKDRDEDMRKSRKLAWTVAGVAGAIALLEAGALILLTPLKTVEPYTLLVDRHTGFVQAVKPLDQQQVSADTALTQSMLVQYVIARESFAIDSVQTNYRRVALWSAENARSEYIAGVQPSNPSSPLARYPRTAVVETHVKSVSPVSPNVAMVRFETRLRGADGQATPTGAWVAMIRYRFSGEPMRVEDRYENPLGFQVVRYRRDQEALTPTEAQPAPPAAAAPPASAPPARTPAPVPAPQPTPPPPKEEVEL